MAGKLNWEEMTKKMKEQKESKASGKKDYNDPNVYKPLYATEPEKGVYPTTRKLVHFVADQEVFEVKVARHAFQINGLWYIGNCHQFHTGQIGSCPVCQHMYNNKLYNTDAGKPFGRKFEYFTNILIKKDALSPELEGTIKLLNYKNELQKILENAMFPQEDEFGAAAEAIIPWNEAGSPDFKLTIIPKMIPNNNKSKKNMNDNILVPQYNKSEFLKENVVIDMSKLTLIDMSYLTKFEDKYVEKSFDRFDKVMGTKKVSVTVSKNVDKDEDNTPPVNDYVAPDTADTTDSDEEFLSSLRDSE